MSEPVGKLSDAVQASWHQFLDVFEPLRPELYRYCLPPRTEVRLHRGEPIVLFWYRHADGDAVRAVARVELDGDRVTHLRNYFFSPDVIAEVCRELAVPFRPNGYRYWITDERTAP